MRVLAITTDQDDPDIREKYRAAAAHDAQLLVATPGGSAATDGQLRFVPVPTRGTATDPGGRRWHEATLKRLIAEHRPEVVHLEADPDSHRAYATGILARKAGIPYTIFSWQSLPPSLGFWAGRRARQVLRDAAGVIGGNRRAMDLLVAKAPRAIATVMPQAGARLPETRRAARTGPLTIGFAGRLVPERGADLLISALGQTFGPWRLLVAGSGPEQERLEALAARHGLASRIEWLGGLRREALDQLWREIDCLAVTSRDTPSWVEYHSPLLLEAMGHGITPIVTNAGCLPDLVGNTGVVVDSAERLTETLQPWVAAPELCRTKGPDARQRVLDRYVTAQVAAQLVTFWQEAIRERAATLAA